MLGPRLISMSNRIFFLRKVKTTNCCSIVLKYLQFCPLERSMNSPPFSPPVLPLTATPASSPPSASATATARRWSARRVSWKKKFDSVSYSVQNNTSRRAPVVALRLHKSVRSGEERRKRQGICKGRTRGAKVIYKKISNPFPYFSNLLNVFLFSPDPWYSTWPPLRPHGGCEPARIY